jgi:hypothetical protein
MKFAHPDADLPRLAAVDRNAPVIEPLTGEILEWNVYDVLSHFTRWYWNWNFSGNYFVEKFHQFLSPPPIGSPLSHLGVVRDDLIPLLTVWTEGGRHWHNQRFRKDGEWWLTTLSTEETHTKSRKNVTVPYAMTLKSHFYLLCSKFPSQFQIWKRQEVIKRA